MNGKSLVTGVNIEIIEDLPTEPKIRIIPEHEALALDLADYSDDEPTVKIQVPIFHNQVVVEENRYPGMGLVIALTLGVAIWFLPCYYFLMWVISR